MGKKVNSDKPSNFESVKIHKDIIALVRQHKKDTRVPISAFFENAALEKLQKTKTK